MRISVTWDNSEQTIVLMKPLGTPNATDLDEAFTSAFDLARTAGHKTVILFDVSTDPLPPAPHILNRARQYFASPPENVAGFVFFGPGTFVTAVARMLALVGGINNIHFAGTHDEARQIVDSLLNT